LDDAARCFNLALECARTEPERRFIQKKLAGIGMESGSGADGRKQDSPLKR
jgi:hypothetical protein